MPHLTSLSLIVSNHEEKKTGINVTKYPFWWTAVRCFESLDEWVFKKSKMRILQGQCAYKMSQKLIQNACIRENSICIYPKK